MLGTVRMHEHPEREAARAEAAAAGEEAAAAGEEAAAAGAEAATGGVVEKEESWSAFYGIQVDTLVDEFFRLHDSSRNDCSAHEMQNIEKEMKRKREEVEKKFKILLELMDKRQDDMARNVNATVRMTETVMRYCPGTRAFLQGNSSDVERGGAADATPSDDAVRAGDGEPQSVSPKDPETATTSNPASGSEKKRKRKRDHTSRPFRKPKGVTETEEEKYKRWKQRRQAREEAILEHRFVPSPREDEYGCESEGEAFFFGYVDSDGEDECAGHGYAAGFHICSEHTRTPYLPF